MYRRVFPNPCAPRTVVVIPSMSLDPEELLKLTGASRYEERFLCLLLLLRLPATRLLARVCGFVEVGLFELPRPRPWSLEFSL